MKRHLHILAVADYCFNNLGDDYYAAINVAETIINGDDGDVRREAFQVHAILEGEL